MGIINEKGAKLTLDTEEYSLLFTVNAIEKFEDEMGESIDSLANFLYDSGKENDKLKIKFGDVAKITWILINECNEIRAERTGEKPEILTLNQIKRRISNANVHECISAIISAYSLSFLKEENEENPKTSSQR